TGNINALGVLTGTLERDILAIGTTTFRPPYTPVAFGAIAGNRSGNLFLPVRRTPPWAWHVRNDADFEPVGHWRRPSCDRRDGEDGRAGANRGILAGRSKLGLLDAWTLRKIEVAGPDAGTFVDRIDTDVMSSLNVGRCRYGLMLIENGFLFDDGVVVRLD